MRLKKVLAKEEENNGAQNVEQNDIVDKDVKKRKEEEKMQEKMKTKNKFRRKRESKKKGKKRNPGSRGNTDAHRGGIVGSPPRRQSTTDMSR